MSTDLMKFIAAIVMYAAWGALAFLGKTDIGPFVGFTMAALGAILGHSSASVSRVVPAGVDVKPGTQGGFSILSFVITLASIAIGIAMISGCTTTTAAAYRGYATEAEAGLKTWDDNALMTVRKVLCAQPYSAIQRNSDMQAGIAALCGPMANVSSLDANQLALLMQLLGKAGVGVAAVPAAVPASAAASGAK